MNVYAFKSITDMKRCLKEFGLSNKDIKKITNDTSELYWSETEEGNYCLWMEELVEDFHVELEY